MAHLLPRGSWGTVAGAGECRCMQVFAERCGVFVHTLRLPVLSASPLGLAPKEAGGAKVGKTSCCYDTYRDAQPGLTSVALAGVFFQSFAGTIK